jgi:glycine betaine/proline transport system ATP-binding protein
MSMVFQHFGLFPHRRVIHNVSYGLEIRGVQKSARLEKAREVLELVGLGGWEEYFPEELSGGMQQRVGLARALAVDPEILLFDEPFSALDPLIRREMQDELLRIQELVQKTIIFITHDFLEALKMGDRIAIMKGGEFIQIGKPDDLVLRPADDYVRKFTEDVPRAKVLTTKTIMKPCELIVNETDQYPGIESKLLEKNCGFVFVLDRTGAFLGIISRQHLHESRDSNLELSNFVLNRSNVASSTSTIDDLVERAAATDEPIAIVDDSKKLVGYVDRACLLSALVH